MIYTVTAVYDKGLFADTRCFGAFLKLHDAREAVRENRCDMHESRYSHLVIECMPTGIHPFAKNEIWYEWQDEWQECEKPDYAQGTINFGIG